MERDRWSSRTTFILGALGSAIGLGNLWRFPYLVFEFGGGSFLIPYFIGLVTIGVPLLFMELALGRQFQGGDPVCFASMHPRLIGIGWMSLFGTVLLGLYYPVLIAWIVVFFCNSFRSPLPWAILEGDNATDKLRGAIGFFNEDVLRSSPSIDIQENWNGILILALAFVWICIYFSIFKGVSIVSKVVKISVPVPIFMLVILFINNLGRDGAEDGVKAYVGNWDLSILDEPAIWQSAIGQVFFSIGICFGIMTAYSSYMESKKGLIQDALMIALMDSLISFFNGFVVFTAVGALAHDLETDFDDKDFRSLIGGGALVFIAYPAAIDGLGSAPQFFSVIFFLTVFFLAIDSAFSLIEAVITAIHDTDWAKNESRELITLGVSILLFIYGLFFTLDNGNYMLDLVDYYLNNFIMIGVGVLECVATMWIFGLKDSSEDLGRPAVITFSVLYGFGGLLAPLLMVAIPKGANVWVGFVAWFVISISAFIVGFILIEEKVPSPPLTRLGKLTYSGGASKFIKLLSIDEYGSEDQVPLGYKLVLYGWGTTCKFLIPVFLSMLLITGTKSNRETLKNDWPSVFQNIGKFIVITAWTIFILFVFVKVNPYSNKREDFEERQSLLKKEEQESEAPESTNGQPHTDGKAFSMDKA